MFKILDNFRLGMFELVIQKVILHLFLEPSFFPCTFDHFYYLLNKSIMYLIKELKQSVRRVQNKK